MPSNTDPGSGAQSEDPVYVFLCFSSYFIVFVQHKLNVSHMGVILNYIRDIVTLQDVRIEHMIYSTCYLTYIPYHTKIIESCV